MTYRLLPTPFSLGVSFSFSLRAPNQAPSSCIAPSFRTFSPLYSPFPLTALVFSDTYLWMLAWYACQNAYTGPCLRHKSFYILLCFSSCDQVSTILSIQDRYKELVKSLEQHRFEVLPVFSGYLVIFAPFSLSSVLDDIRNNVAVVRVLPLQRFDLLLFRTPAYE